MCNSNDSSCFHLYFWFLVLSKAQGRIASQGEIPQYPSAEQSDTLESFRKVIQEDEKVCKSWGATWFKKRQKIAVSAPKIAADGLVKAIRLVEKVGAKTDKNMRKGRVDSNEKWPKKEIKILQSRINKMKKGCSKSELKHDLKEQAPQLARWYVHNVTSGVWRLASVRLVVSYFPAYICEQVDFT